MSRVPGSPGSCSDCLAWGVLNNHGICLACKSFRQRHERGQCRTCRSSVPVYQGACRLCRKQASTERHPKGALQLDQANRHGQQLFFADMDRRLRLSIPLDQRAPYRVGQRRDARPPAAPVFPVPHEQLLLVELPRDWAAGRLAGYLNTTGPTTIERWFDRHTSALPTQMISELRVWFTALLRGSTTPLRVRPRAENTIRNLLYGALPALQHWAPRYESLREIARDDVVKVLAEIPERRLPMLLGLRSIFRFLKAGKLVFINPTARIPVGRWPTRIPAVSTERTQDALNSDNPAAAALAACIAFHALRVDDLRHLQHTDYRDRRLWLGDRTILLAEPVVTRLLAYTTDRFARWPRTVNPHLFINHQSATHSGPVSVMWVTLVLGTSADAIRQDRALDELRATGDVRRLCDLFGLSIEAANRYAALLAEEADSSTSSANPGIQNAADQPSTLGFNDK